MHPGFQRIWIDILVYFDVVLLAVQVELVEEAAFDTIRQEVAEILMVHIYAVEVVCRVPRAVRTVIRQFGIALGGGLAQFVVIADVCAEELSVPQIDWLAVQVHPLQLFLFAIVVAVDAEGRRLDLVDGLTLDVRLEVPLRLQYESGLLSGAVLLIEVAAKHFGRVQLAQRVFLPLLLVLEQGQPSLILLRNRQPRSLLL